MRKGTEIPYVSHLLAVSALVLEHGGDEDQAIAGLLHDAAEDQGGEARIAELESLFGPGVSRIVDDCTDRTALKPASGDRGCRQPFVSSAIYVDPEEARYGIL